MPHFVYTQKSFLTHRAKPSSATDTSATVGLPRSGDLNFKLHTHLAGLLPSLPLPNVTIPRRPSSQTPSSSSLSLQVSGWYRTRRSASGATSESTSPADMFFFRTTLTQRFGRAPPSASWLCTFSANLFHPATQLHSNTRRHGIHP